MTGGASADPKEPADGRVAPQRLCVRIDHAVRILGIGRTKLYELIGSGDLEIIRIGRRTLVLRPSIDALIARLRAPPAD